MLFCRRTHKVEDGVQLNKQQIELLQRLEEAIADENPDRSRSE